MSVTAIESLEPRRRATIAGKIRAVRSYERPFPRTDAEVDDGTGVVLLRFVGRSHVPGIEQGRRILADGTPGTEGNVLVMLNPLYSFEPTE